MTIDSLLSRELLKRYSKRYSRFGRFTLLFVLGVCYAGCGAVGPLIPPEDVGIEAKRLEQQRQQEEKTLPVEGILAGEEELELPPLRPIGTR